MWSQMHGDEPTATSALIDMFAYLQTHRDKDWVERIANELTIRAVPMLNPDGEELYQRRNVQDIDVNRDARDLKTPEARLLKKLRDDWSPDIGFNLHNQNELTTAGKTSNQAAISLLVVYGDAAKTTNPGLERNRRLTSAIVEALQNYIPGHIGRYDDDYTASAFGDNFSAWGTPVILIETGALQGKDEMFFVKLNFIAFLTALTKLADGSEKNLSTALYDQLPENTSGRVYSFVFRNATLVSTQDDQLPHLVTIAVNKDRRRASLLQSAHVTAIGEIGGMAGLEDYDATGFYVTARNGVLKVTEPAELLFYRKDRVVDWSSKDLEKEFPPDAIFSFGRWAKGSGVISKR
jgi:hypothetical protein